ncbi:E3 ubiquitin-protein ligase TRAIP-like [Mercenaria mercenaria]|uniref:E3 ubiquitin-protein ligase TRAIP-like n=1 Tax=Mercenaria mercenaria TaxID=6596 RepID=UPI00234FA361|nr:E3 ubiquitin-protein ligase TRAIP-like [Mercenaria mercenaria]XP_053408982.1 E3 ubiquitin-protein ligase TRAIP-like [Mercenaria mercenaria]
MAESQSVDNNDSMVEQMLTCPICMHDMSGVSITHCGHRFCTPCILQWLEQHPNCPACRKQITDSHLIEDQNFDELVRALKEARAPVEENNGVDNQDQQQQPQTGETGSASVEKPDATMIQRDQDIRNLTNSLLALKDREITKLEAVIQEHADTITQLNDKVRGLETNIMTLRTASLQTMNQKKSLEDKLRENTQELQTAKAQLVELETTEKECLQLSCQVQQLQMFESMYEDTAYQLKHLNENVLPSKDSTIAQLQEKTLDLINETASLRQNNIPLDQHVHILQTNLQQTIQKLQHYYDEEYGTKITRTEKVNDTLRKLLEEKENELQNREDVGDELKSATRTYKKLIKENCDLKDTVKEQGKQIQRLTQDYAHSKERTNELEHKISVYKNLRGEE